MIIVHHLNHSRSQRILWFLEELGVPYQVQRYERDPQTMLAPTALKDPPAGQIAGDRRRRSDAGGIRRHHRIPAGSL